MKKNKKKELTKEEQKKKEVKTQKINMWITNIVRILLIAIIIRGIIVNDNSQMFIALLTIALTFYPSILSKRFGVYLPASMQIVITLFIFGAQYLGEIKDFYRIIPWWDTLLHTTSGVILGVIGFMFVYLLNEKYGKKVKLSPFFVVMFAFCFAVTMGVFWEFFEFGADRILGTNMQKFRFPELGDDGLVDTMQDLMVDALGALFTSVIGYFYIKKKNDILLRDVFKSWFRKDKKQKEEKDIDKEQVIG